MRQNIIKVLLVIENEIQAEFLEMILQKKNNYKVAKEFNGKEIFEKLKNNPENYIDTVIVIGYQLPDMDGLMIMSELKNLGCMYAFIFLTADKIVERAIEAMKCGALDFISKSDNLTDILPEMIEKVYYTQKLKIDQNRIKKKLEERRIALEELAAITSEINNGVIIYDNNGAIEWMNEGYTRITGFTLPQHIKKYGGHYILKTYDDELQNEIRRSIENNKPYSYIVKAKTIEDSDLRVLISLSPAFDENGNIKKIVKVISDITEVRL